MTNDTCRRGHIWRPETTYRHFRTIRSGKKVTYRECSICVKERTPTGKKRTARTLAMSTVVRDDWSDKQDCPRCHAPLMLDDDGDPKCLLHQHTPRAFIQVMIA